MEERLTGVTADSVVVHGEALTKLVRLVMLVIKVSACSAQCGTNYNMAKRKREERGEN